MRFYDIHAGLAILAASRKIMLIQFMLMGIVNIVHNGLAWVERFSVHGSGLKRRNWVLAKEKQVDRHKSYASIVKNKVKNISRQ
jgi:hypothetical protein